MDIFELRNKYPEFIYKNYNIEETFDKVILNFCFEIPGLEKFNPKIEILKNNFEIKNLNTNIAKNIVFNIGMVEAISYYKATCSPKFIVECGALNDRQIKWFEKLIYLGLGELRYKNNIDISEDEFVKIISRGKNVSLEKETFTTKGIIIPVGGGKDSNVTMELLKDFKQEINPLYIGNKQVPIDCAILAGYSKKQIIKINRSLDKNILKLNDLGYINGHTPFSALVAFTAYFLAFILGKKYIVLSNEDSANETNVEGKNINHQYSKTIEFEDDFRLYAKKYLAQDIEYFSLLRPINELQIAMLFSKMEKYHKVFKSCNVGSKNEKWKWCNNCPKCLFVYIILSPFLYKEKLINIFGEDLFERKDLEKTFIELCGYGDIKPFECVGTYNEVKYAITKTISALGDRKLPYLLEYYKDNFELYDLKDNKLKCFNNKNNVPEEFLKVLRKEI